MVFFRSAATLISMVVVFALAAWILGNTPVNRSFQNADEGIEIHILNNGVHADFVFPIRTENFNWMDHLSKSDFLDDRTDFHYGIFGWGNRQFYMETRTWDDLKVFNLLYAFAGMGNTVVHVELLSDSDHWDPTKAKKIRLSPSQYKKLCEYVLDTFRTDNNRLLTSIPDHHYHQQDAFYEAKGHYHLFRTCNVWVGSGLARAGVRVGYWTLTPDLLFSCIPDCE
jgi:uncharacterized protein (TIGR02117 family)